MNKHLSVGLKTRSSLQKAPLTMSLLCLGLGACSDVDLGGNAPDGGASGDEVPAAPWDTGIPGTGDSGIGDIQGADGTATDGATASAAMLVISATDGFWRTGAKCTEVSGGIADVTVDDMSLAQTWEGFGGAFNEMGWSYLATQALQDEAVDLLFGTEGCRFALGRIPVGANDYASERYTLDETPSDTSMASFSIERDRQRLIPFIKAAQRRKPDIRFWANPWTPPTWMKDPPFASGDPTSPFDGGSMKDDDPILAAYALYLVKFVQAYGKEGIPIEVVVPQNEPSYSENYPSCTWSASLYTKFVGNYLGPALHSAALGTKVMLGTLSSLDLGSNDPAILSSVMEDSTTKPYIVVLGLQWGMTSVIGTAKAYGLPIWVTEHKAGNYPWNPVGSPPYVEPAPNDVAYAVESWGEIRDAIKAGVSGYNAWNMVLDRMGKGTDTKRQWAQNALLVVEDSRIIKTPTYYVFRHFSQFVDVGAKVLSTSGEEALTFENPDGTIVLVMYNGGAAKSPIVEVVGRKLQFEMPAGPSWATIVYKP